MGKVCIEVCLISARGLRRSSSFWKLQWYAVGWINPEQKYCSRIDNSGSSNPTWKTKFSASFDDSDPNLHGLALNVEVYSREPLFLRQKLHGTATILLREFLAMFANNSEVEEFGSFQLRKKKSGKPRGFIDISIRISEREGLFSYSGHEEGGFKLSDHHAEIPLHFENGSPPSYPYQPHRPSAGPPGNYHHPPPAYPYSHAAPSSANYPNPSNASPGYTPANYPSTSTARPGHTEANCPDTSTAGPGNKPANYPNPATARPGYQRSNTPPPPPPPTNVGFVPTVMPGAGPYPPSHYINMPSSTGAGQARGRTSVPGFGAGLGAGALAAGAVIFGDDFMSGFDFPLGYQDGGSLTITADPPF